MTDTRPLRGGMVGAGAWSRNQLSAWTAVAGAGIVALADRHPERLNPVADAFGIAERFGSLEAMLDGASLDFVDIATRPASHPALVRIAAERGLPILCQKPFCETLDEAAALVRLCRDSGVRLMVNENFRWQEWYRKARALIDESAIGRPFLARLQERARVTLPTFQHPQRYFADMPRLVLFEMGVHYLDTCRYLFGDPATVYARLHKVSDDIAGEDVQALTLGYPDVTCQIVQSWASVPVPGIDRPEAAQDVPAPPRLEIEGTRGTLALNGDGTLHLVTDDAHETWFFGARTRPDAWVAALTHFADCLRTGADFETSGEETLKTMALVHAAYQSAFEGRVVAPYDLLPAC